MTVPDGAAYNTELPARGSVVDMGRLIINGTLQVIKWWTNWGHVMNMCIWKVGSTYIAEFSKWTNDNSVDNQTIWKKTLVKCKSK